MAKENKRINESASKAPASRDYIFNCSNFEYNCMVSALEEFFYLIDNEGCTPSITKTEGKNIFDDEERFNDLDGDQIVLDRNKPDEDTSDGDYAAWNIRLDFENEHFDFEYIELLNKSEDDPTCFTLRARNDDEENDWIEIEPWEVHHAYYNKRNDHLRELFGRVLGLIHAGGTNESARSDVKDDRKLLESLVKKYGREDVEKFIEKVAGR